MINFGGIPWQSTPGQFKGKLIAESSENYVGDFTEDLKKNSAAMNIEEYKNYLIEKSKCVKLTKGNK